MPNPIFCQNLNIGHLLLPFHLLCPLQPLVLFQEPHMEQYLYAVRIALDVGTLLLGR